MSNKKNLDRCTGHCCQALTIPIGPQELINGYLRWKSGGSTRPLLMSKPDDHEQRHGPLWTDIHLIAPMLEYIGKSSAPYRRVNPADGQLRGDEPEHHFYRCKLFDAKTGNCSIYEIRPQMCRDYPYRGTCNYAQCTWEERKAKKETPAERRKRKKRLLFPEKFEKDLIKKQVAYLENEKPGREKK